MRASRDLDPSSNLLAFFGAELRQLRIAAGLSQEELAARICYSTSLVSMVETARRVPTKDFAERADAALATGGTLTRLWPLATREALPRWFRPFAEIERARPDLRLREGSIPVNADLTRARWRKSSYSGGSGGNCVEVATNLPGLVAIRDSNHPEGPALLLTPAQWHAFTDGLSGHT